MPTVKITVRLTTPTAAALAHRAAAADRGISNCVESLICQALRRPGPRPDHPYDRDQRYTARPRARARGG